MLKPPNDPSPKSSDSERSVSELIHQLIDDGKAYAWAEFNVVKVIVEQKVEAFKLPAILFGLAFLLSFAAIGALAYGVAAGLATLIGPLAGGAVAFLLFAGLAAGMAWWAIAKIREGL